MGLHPGLDPVGDQRLSTRLEQFQYVRRCGSAEGLYQLGDVGGGYAEAVLVLVTEHRRGIEVLGVEGQAVHASGNGDMQRIALPQSDRRHPAFTSTSAVLTITVPWVRPGEPSGTRRSRTGQVSERPPRRWRPKA